MHAQASRRSLGFYSFTKKKAPLKGGGVGKRTMRLSPNRLPGRPRFGAFTLSLSKTALKGRLRRLRRPRRPGHRIPDIKKERYVCRSFWLRLVTFDYSSIAVTTPEPTVLPPSLIANLRPASIAIGVISSMSIRMLSPGMHISTPSGSFTVPVTSVVRK